MVGPKVEAAARYAGSIFAHVAMAVFFVTLNVAVHCFIVWSLDPWREYDWGWWLRLAVVAGIAVGIWRGGK